MKNTNNSNLETKYKTETNNPVSSFEEFAKLSDYSLISELKADPESTADGMDHDPRQVFSGHYVPVTPTPISDPKYISHSKIFFKELGLDDKLALDEKFLKIFSGDTSFVAEPMKKQGWATGYALTIYGTEYTEQCPFRTGNGYGDGRAISIFEGKLNGKRWEMQLKGGGRTPYCRGGDGRAVLRSSVREFLAQEYMHALGVPSSRSLTLYTSKTETVARPWYSDNSSSFNPDIMVNNPVAISTRVAPSFIRVGQIELFARRARNLEHPNALQELRTIVSHLIKREYQNEIDQSLSFEKQVLDLARLFRERLTSLVANWIRVGYCQGNFNSDNCPAGGYTLDYGPFGFCEDFDYEFQPWTGGGKHFSFFNQPAAAEKNYHMFYKSIRLLLPENSSEVSELDKTRKDFEKTMKEELKKVWTNKLGLKKFDSELVQSLLNLMTESKVDYTIFFRELSTIPTDIVALEKSFYLEASSNLKVRWKEWLTKWRKQVLEESNQELTEVSVKMKKTNPKYAWREWLIVPAYQKAALEDYSLVRELQEVLNNPYEEQSKEIEEKYYRLKPKEFFNAGGVSQYSCSS